MAAAPATLNSCLPAATQRALLGGSWVVISGVISRVTILNIVITHIRGLLTPLITTHEHPSRGGMQTRK